MTFIFRAEWLHSLCANSPETLDIFIKIIYIVTYPCKIYLRILLVLKMCCYNVGRIKKSIKFLTYM